MGRRLHQFVSAILCLPIRPGVFLAKALLSVLQLCAMAFLTATSTVALAQEPPEVPEPATQSEKQDEPTGSSLPEPLESYMGRRIAPTMSFAHAEWLTRNEREQEERCSLLLTNLDLHQGMTVCDVGCGNGFHSLKIAHLIGEKGRVLAVDVQPEMLELLRKRMEAGEIDNITPVLGSYHDPRLPDSSCDLVLMVDVYHEFNYPEQMLAAIRRALRPDGVIALVEFRLEDPEVPIVEVHKMSKEQILKEYSANGFRLVKEFDDLPWQHLMFFGKDGE
jgi:ubiquinone/menaquinone biosynthesis C-methylase UbiE